MKAASSIALVGLLLAAAPAIAQAPPQAPVPPVGDQRLLVKQVEDTMMGFVRSSAIMAGAVSACSPPEAVIIHDCAMLILKVWNKASKQPQIGDLEFWKQVQETWGSYSVGAHNMQVKEHPATCDDIMAREAQSLIFKYCERTGSTPTPSQGGRGFDMTSPPDPAPSTPAR